jgi:hypothetical protein
MASVSMDVSDMAAIGFFSLRFEDREYVVVWLSLGYRCFVQSSELYRLQARYEQAVMTDVRYK